MKAYKSKIQIDKLTELRDKFFSDRISKQGKIWNNIRYATIYDSQKCENLLEALHLKPVNGCMNQLLNPHGIMFIVPNFCINDPYFEKTVKNQENNHKVVKYKIKFINCYTSKRSEMQVEDNYHIFELKQLYAINEELNKDPSLIRMFYSGAELKDEYFLYQYEIKDDITVNVMVK